MTHASKRTIGFIVALGGIFFLAPTPTAFASGEKIAIIGSSSFNAFCKIYKFNEALKTGLSAAAVDCFTASGASPVKFESFYNNDVKGKGYTHLIIYAGLNGLNNKPGLTSAQNSLKKIFSSAKSEGIKIIMVSAQPFKGYTEWTELWGKNIKENNAWLKTKPEGVNIFIDLYNLFDKNGDAAGDDEFYAGTDHLHFKKNGHELMLNLIFTEGFNTKAGVPTTPGKNKNPTNLPYKIIPKSKPPTVSEVEQYIQLPKIKIKIPGLSFSDPTITTSSDSSGSIFISTPYLAEYIAATYKYLVVIAGIFCVARIIIGGFLWSTGGFSQDSIAGGKTIITSSLLGLVLVIISYAILYFINPELVRFRGLQIRFIPGEDFPAYDRGEPYNSGNSGGTIDNNSFDALFQKYGACLTLDWRSLKAMAFIESNFNPTITNSSGFTGLFQTKTIFCKGVLKKYPGQLSNVCNDLTNPEANTMAATSIMRSSLKMIKEKCPTITPESLYYFAYIGHHNGTGALKIIINKTCDYNQSYQASYDFWTTHEKGKYADSTGKKRTAKHIAKEGDNAGKKMMAQMKKLGVTAGFIPDNKAACPLDTPNLRFK